MRPIFLITRPQEDAETLARQLDALGIDSLVEPLLTIHPLNAATELTTALAARPQAIAITSRHALPALEPWMGRLPIPLFAVGDATAAAVRAQGLRAESAEGDAAALAELIKEKCDPAQGVILYLTGREITRDLTEDLKLHGFQMRRILVYAAEPATSLTDKAIHAFKEEQLKGALFFSPRSAGIFSMLMTQHNLIPHCVTLTAYCLSQAVTEGLGNLPFHEIKVSQSPSLAAMLAMIRASVG